MNLQEIKKAVKEGKTVHWKNENYKVIFDEVTGLMIKSISNENYIGLTHANGKTLNGEEADFYTKKD